MTDKAKDENSGVEQDSDPMKGVKEIKGADAPMEPEVKIDIEKHKDEEDPDAANGKNHKESAAQPAAVPEATVAEATPVPPTAEVTPAAAQAVTPVPAATPAPAAQNVKQKHTGRNLILIILLVLCFLCVACCVGTYVLRDQLLRSITNSTSRQDSTLQTVTKDEVQSSNTDLEALVQQKKSTAQVAADGTYKMSFTEEELLTALFKNSNGDIDPTAVGLKFEPGVAKIQIDIGSILATQQSTLQNSEQLKNLPFDISLLNGLLITADLTTSADGTKLAIENLSTGNAFLDSLIPQATLNDLENQFDLSKISTSGEDGMDLNIQKIEFLAGEMRLTVKE